MEGISAEYTKGKQRRPYREYQILQYKRNRAKKKGNQEQADEYLRQMQNIPALDPMDKNYQRVKYVRYADDFVVCIIGARQQRMKSRKELQVSCKRNFILN